MRVTTPFSGRCLHLLHFRRRYEKAANPGVGDVSFGKPVPMNRQVDFDEQTDFSQYKTFMIGAGRITTSKPELKTPIVKERMESAIRSELQQKGLRKVSSQPDLIVNYALGAANKARRRPGLDRGWSLPTVCMGPHGRCKCSAATWLSSRETVPTPGRTHYEFLKNRASATSGQSLYLNRYNPLLR